VTLPEDGRSRRGEQKRATQRRIREAAVALFAQQGFASTTVTDIARAAGTSVRTVHLYFPSKEDVLFGDFDDALEDLRTALRSRSSGEPALAVLASWARGFLDEHPPDAESERLVNDLLVGSEPIRARALRHLLGLETAVAAAVAEDAGLDAAHPRVRMIASAAASALRELHGGALAPEHRERIATDPVGEIRAAADLLLELWPALGRRPRRSDESPPEVRPAGEQPQGVGTSPGLADRGLR
jgi:AcrR family transcriptional regulator